MGTYMTMQLPEDRLKSSLKVVDERLRSLSLGGECPAFGLWNEEDIAIEMEKLNTTGHGCPDIYPLGYGSIKLSGAVGYSEDPEEHSEGSWSPQEIAALVDALVWARDEHGLELNVPTNVGDYLDQEVIDRLIPRKEMAAKRRKETVDHKTWTRAREKAMAAAREKYGDSGVFPIKDWGPAGGPQHWAMFGSLQEETDEETGLKFQRPVWLEVRYDRKGRLCDKNSEETRSELYRTRDGGGVMLLPLCELGGSGLEKINLSLKYAWEHLGLRTDPLVLFIGMYRQEPSSVTVTGTPLEIPGEWTCDGKPAALAVGEYVLDRFYSTPYREVIQLFTKPRRYPGTPSVTLKGFKGLAYVVETIAGA
jgi:hypothetical protein